MDQIPVSCMKFDNLHSSFQGPTGCFSKAFDDAVNLFYIKLHRSQKPGSK